MFLIRSWFGLKGFVIVDVDNGYVLNIIIYIGKEGFVVSKDFVFRVVM